MGDPDTPKTVVKKEQYTARELGILFGVSTGTACRMIDKGIVPGHKVPGGRERRVMHETLEEYVRAHPEYEYVLKKIIN